MNERGGSVFVAMRLLLFLVALAAAQYALAGLFEDNFSPSRYWRDLIGKARTGTIVYFGDSTTFATAQSEEDKRDMAAIMLEPHPELDLEPIFHAATSVRLWSAILEARFARGIVPSCIVMDVHLGAFSDAWLLRPSFLEAQHRNSVKFLRPGLPAWYRAARTFKVGNYQGIEQYERMPIVFQGEVVGRFGETGRGTIKSEREQRAWAYGTLLTDDVSQEALRCYDRVLEQAAKRNVPVIAYFTPMNYERVCELTWPGATEVMAKKRDRLIAHLRQRGAVVLDMMLDLDKTQFQSELLDHHLLSEGRRHVALRVAEEVKRHLKNAASAGAIGED